MAVFEKFAKATTDPDANKFGITNDRGEIVTAAYLRRYIQCWCRKENGFVQNRSENFDYFMSDEFLSQQVGKTASQVGKAASLDARWGRTVPAAGTKPAAKQRNAQQVVNAIAEDPTKDFATNWIQNPDGSATVRPGSPLWNKLNAPPAPVIETPAAPTPVTVPQGGLPSKPTRKERMAAAEAAARKLKAQQIEAMRQSLADKGDDPKAVAMLAALDDAMAVAEGKQEPTPATEAILDAVVAEPVVENEPAAETPALTEEQADAELDRHDEQEAVVEADAQ